MEDVTSISKKSGQKQDSWRDKGRKNTYKRGEGYHREAVEKYQEKDLEKSKIDRESEIVFLISFLSLLIPHTSGKKFVCRKPSYL